MSPRARHWGQATLKALVLSGLLGVSAVSATQATATPALPEAPPAWIVYFLLGAATLLYIIKEVRTQFGHPPKRAHDENMVQQLAKIVEDLTAMRSQLATLEAGRERNWGEIERLREVADGIEERISRGMSKVASQMTVSLASMQETTREGLDDLRNRVGLLEQRRRR